MSFCPDCGERAAAGARFCARCGRALADGPAPAAPARADALRIADALLLVGGILGIALGVLMALGVSLVTGSLSFGRSVAVGGLVGGLTLAILVGSLVGGALALAARRRLAAGDRDGAFVRALAGGVTLLLFATLAGILVLVAAVLVQTAPRPPA